MVPTHELRPQWFEDNLSTGVVTVDTSDLGPCYEAIQHFPLAVF
jgi:hypothetical protein